MSFVDLAPTVLSIAGVTIPSYMQGRAVLGEQKGPVPEYVFGGRNRMDENSDDFIRTCRDKRYQYIRNFTPQVPYAQKIPYMDRMPIMQEWRRLDAEGKLTGPQKLFFQPVKPAEELYDVISDPYEVRNLAALPEHRDTLARMRAALQAWMTKIGDQGGDPEDQLIERMWPGGKQPLTADPVVQSSPAVGGKRSVRITCPTEGASIGYKTTAKGRWLLYSGPLGPGTGYKTARPGDPPRLPPQRRGDRGNQTISVPERDGRTKQVLSPPAGGDENRAPDPRADCVRAGALRPHGLVRVGDRAAALRASHVAGQPTRSR